MSTEIVQIRDVPSEDLSIIRSRAKADNTSVSAYLRRLIHDDAARPTMAQTLHRIARREPVPVTDDDIVELIDLDRR